jgi:biopolymer transport protein ExbD
MAADLHIHGDGEDDAIATINIIPFVDIVLVLLIIFMLTSIAIVRASMVVNLPKAATGGARVESTVNIVCNKDGSLMLNGARSTIEQIGSFVKRESKTNPKLQAVIAADKSVEYGHVVDLIDLVKRNGVSAFALDVEREMSASAP